MTLKYIQTVGYHGAALEDTEKISPKMTIAPEPIRMVGAGVYLWDNCHHLATAFAKNSAEKKAIALAMKGKPQSSTRAGVVECLLQVHRDHFLDLASPAERSLMVSEILKFEKRLIESGEIDRLYANKRELVGAFLMGLWVRLYTHSVEGARGTSIQALRFVTSLEPTVMQFVFNEKVHKLTSADQLPKIPGITRNERNQMRNESDVAQRFPNVGIAWVVRDGSVIKSAERSEVYNDFVPQ